MGRLPIYYLLDVQILSYDEEPAMRVLGTTAGDRTSVADTDKNSSIYRDYEYVRSGALSLLAAIDLLTGKDVPLVSGTHKSSDFVRFLKLLDKNIRRGIKSALSLIIIPPTHRRRYKDI